VPFPFPLPLSSLHLSSCALLAFLRYCNSRIMKFSASGAVLHIWDTPVDGTSLFVPHKAILNVAETMLYVADRENRRLVSYNTRRVSTPGKVFRENMAGAPYAISLNTSSSSSSSSWQMFGVFGGMKKDGPFMGFTLDSYGQTVGKWGPKQVRVAPRMHTYIPDVHTYIHNFISFCMM